MNRITFERLQQLSTLPEQLGRLYYNCEAIRGNIFNSILAREIIYLQTDYFFIQLRHILAFSYSFSGTNPNEQAKIAVQLALASQDAMLPTLARCKLPVGTSQNI